VENFCEFSIEPSGSIRYWETIERPNNSGASRVALSSTELVMYSALNCDNVARHNAGIFVVQCDFHW
jgi:hypothetical protein